MLRSGQPALVRQELAAWAVGTEMTRGVARDAALAAVPAPERPPRRAARRAPRDLPRPRPPRGHRRDPRRENRLRDPDQGNREIPHHRRPEPASRAQVEVTQQLRARHREGHRHPHRAGHHHHGQPARLTSGDTAKESRHAPAGPWSRPSPGPARRPSACPQPGTTHRHQNPETGTDTQMPKPRGIGSDGPPIRSRSPRGLAASPIRADTREVCTCALARWCMEQPVTTTAGASDGREAEPNAEERRKVIPPPLFAVPGAYAAGWLPSLVLSWLRVLRAVRSSAARTAIAARSSMRSGSPCLSRERRASCAPALRISARSSGLNGRRGGRRTWGAAGPGDTHLLPSWPGRGLVGRGASPARDDSQDWPSPPFRCSQIRLGPQRYAPGGTRGNITV